jgi:hypothetical protein
MTTLRAVMIPVPAGGIGMRLSNLDERERRCRC